MEQLLNYLHSINALSPALREHLLDTLKFRSVQKRTMMLKAGHISRYIYFIQKGLARCFYIKNDMEVNNWFMKEGDVIVSVRSFFSQTPGYEWIETLEDTEVYYISFDELQYIYLHFPEFNYTGRQILQHYYALSEERLYSLRMHRSNERYEYFMHHFPDLSARLPNKYIASYLGVRHETISRIRAGKW